MSIGLIFLSLSEGSEKSKEDVGTVSLCPQQKAFWLSQINTLTIALRGQLNAETTGLTLLDPN